MNGEIMRGKIIDEYIEKDPRYQNTLNHMWGTFLKGLETLTKFGGDR